LQVAPPARRHVGDDRNDAASGRRCDLHRRTFDVFRRQGIERDVGAGLGEHPCNSLTDAASRSRDEDDFSRDIEFDRHHDVFSGEYYGARTRLSAA
jgi:hypothetical protein